MNQPNSHYYLYCMNIQCKVSIYHHTSELQLPFTAENLGATHICKCCDQPLVSAMDIEIKKVMSEIRPQKINKVNHLDN
jgi:hypothetical protein